MYQNTLKNIGSYLFSLLKENYSEQNFLSLKASEPKYMSLIWAINYILNFLLINTKTKNYEY